MSSRRREAILTRPAQRDYHSIQLYTSRQWGREQATRYMDEIDAIFDRLCDYPELGPVRFDLPGEPRCFSVNRHLIVYRIHPDVIEIVRILHERADPTRHL
jgi:toxin ParE1/3/4